MYQSLRDARTETFKIWNFQDLAKIGLVKKTQNIQNVWKKDIMKFF